MTIQEMFAAGMSREEVAAELVKGKMAPNLLRARFIIALALGEIDGDVLSDEPGKDEDSILLRVKAAWEQRQRALTEVRGDD